MECLKCRIDLLINWWKQRSERVSSIQKSLALAELHLEVWKHCTSRRLMRWVVAGVSLVGVVVFFHGLVWSLLLFGLFPLTLLHRSNVRR